MAALRRLIRRPDHSPRPWQGINLPLEPAGPAERTATEATAMTRRPPNLAGRAGPQSGHPSWCSTCKIGPLGGRKLNSGSQQWAHSSRMEAN